MVNEDNDDYDEEGDEYYDDEDIGGDLADSDAASVTCGLLRDILSRVA